MLCMSTIGLGGMEARAENNAPSVAQRDRASRIADLYVSPSGSDAWSGTLAAPNRARTDGPLKTIAFALRTARRIRAQKAGGEGITILVRKGVHLLDEPLQIEPEDSGRQGRPTRIAAYPGEKPIVSGGTRLTGWQETGGRWKLTLPEVREGRWSFEQLFVNGQRRYRPRLPKNGYYHIVGEAPASPQAQGKGFDRFVFAGEDIRADWRNRDQIDLLCFQQWTMARMRIAEVDPTHRTVRLARPTLNAQWYFALPAGHRYIVENVREALSEPGEWYLDRKTGELTYIPMRRERPDRTEAWAPRLEYLVEFRGDPDARRWVEHVEISGIAFAHANWVTPADGYQSSQAEAPIGGAIRAVGARSCRLDACSIRHVGGYAIDIGAACRQVAIENCEITDMGAGGVKLGEARGNDDPELLSGDHTVRNCLIAHGGRMHPAGIGVWIGASPNNTVAHNEICDLYYSGISVGWSWGYAPTASHHNVIEYNHIHDIGQGVLSDMGATYTLGLAPGSVQRNNVFHHIESHGYGGWGIYFDEGTTGMLAENNLVYACKSAGFHQHYGRENTVRNNIFALNGDSQLMRTRAEDHLSFTFERNIVYWDKGPLLASNWSGDNYRFRDNLYWRIDGKPLDFAGMTLDAWRAKGNDASAIIEDPLFVNPRKADFRLRAGSPASRIGFVPFDFSKAGRVGIGLARTTAVAKPRAYPGPPPPPPPTPISLDFEDHPVGWKAVGAVTSEEGDSALIRVTDEAALSGKHSLKFVDRPGLKANYNPHAFWQPRFNDGLARTSFALRLEPGTTMYHEWRDDASPYHAGPHLIVRPDGALMARDRKLAHVPWNAWVRLEIVCRLGEKSSGKYDVTVRLPGRTAPLTFKDLPCDPQFHRLDWLGFVADADAHGVFYLDDLTVTRQ